jgi:DNA-binding transcriptional regulator YhcF (GntR family)
MTAREPVYLQIAAELRERIRNGSLKPGQRIPSTRRLAKTWKVALATASKALSLLAQEGTLRAVPRVGNVVSGSLAHEGGLSRASIVEAAIAIADQEGFGALSMRGVASKMGYPVTSLYRHVAKKEDLLRFMVDVVLLEERPSPKRGLAGWRARVEQEARMEWRMAKKHPWVARVLTLTRPIPSESSLMHAEWMLCALEETGADAETRMSLHVTIYGFVQGLATNLESEAQAQGDTGVDEEAWMQVREPEFAAMAATGAFPAFARMLSGLADGFDLDLDRIFEFGLGLLLDGFTQFVERREASGSSRDLAR